MAKLEQIQRLLYIAELLKTKPDGITYEETKNFLEKKFEEKPTHPTAHQQLNSVHQSSHIA